MFELKLFLRRFKAKAGVKHDPILESGSSDWQGGSLPGGG
jgi:hypothetical protein